MGENDVHQVRCPEWDKCLAKGKCPKGFDRINGCYGIVEKGLVREKSNGGHTKPS